MKTFPLAGRTVGPGHPCFVIAEVAQAHDGSLSLAHDHIDAAADAGADAVKFQTHIAEAESSPAEPWRVHFSRRDETRYEYWKRMEFTAEEWRGLRDHARERGLVFLSTPFSEEAVGLLDRLDAPAWKVASGEVTNPMLLEAMTATGKPLLVSTGMSRWVELDALDRRLGDHPAAFLQCTTRYPCPLDAVGLNIVDELRQRYGRPAGLSDHTGRPFAALAAAALGMDVLEVHIALTPRISGPDASSSLDFETFRLMVEGVRAIEEMRAHPVDKDATARDLEDVRRIFTRSLTARLDLEPGLCLGPEHLVARKPAGGIPPTELDRLVGRTLRAPVPKGQVLNWSDLEP